MGFGANRIYTILRYPWEIERLFLILLTQEKKIKADTIENTIKHAEKEKETRNNNYNKKNMIIKISERIDSNRKYKRYRINKERKIMLS